MIRKEIHNLFSSMPEGTLDEWSKLKKCLILDKDYSNEDFNRLQDWFNGCIKSLFYQPNELILGLVGPQGIGKTWFFRDLLPNHKWYADGRSMDLYERFILNAESEPLRQIKYLASNDGFRIPYSMKVEKRLASICFASNSFNVGMDRKRILLIFLKDIDKELYNSIDKKKLWQQIYCNFWNNNSGKHPFTNEYINKCLI